MAHLGPTEPRWAPCWPRGLRYLALYRFHYIYSSQNCILTSIRTICFRLLKWPGIHTVPCWYHVMETLRITGPLWWESTALSIMWSHSHVMMNMSNLGCNKYLKRLKVAHLCFHVHSNIALWCVAKLITSHATNNIFLHMMFHCFR